MNNLLHRTKLFFSRNSSTILTCVGGVGVIVTSVMAAKATPKALMMLEEAKEEKGEELTKLEIVAAAGPAYIPAVIAGVGTIACVVGANILNKRQQGSLMSAYALVETSFKEYKNKVKELHGEDFETQVRDEIAKDKFEESDFPVDSTKRLFFDEFSGRYFESTIEDVQNAEYFINRDLSMRDWATINEFYEYLKIPPIDGGDELGWSSGMNFDYYWQSWIDFAHRKTLIDDDLECIIITMFGEPSTGWDDYA